MNTRWLKVRLVLLAGLGLMVLAGCCGFVVCGTPPPGPCPIEEFLLDLDMLPGQGWDETGSRETRDAPARMGIEAISTAFSATRGVVVQAIYRFWEAGEAVREYQESIRDTFTAQGNEGPWLVPPELAGLGLNADQGELRCSRTLSHGIERCEYVGRYGTYLVELGMDTLVVPYADVRRLVVEIDGRMSRCVARTSNR